MTIYTAVLFLHTIAVLVLTAALAMETWMLIQLRRGAAAGEVLPSMLPPPGLAIVAIGSLLTVFVTGGYLTESLSSWKFAWPRFAVLVVVLFAVFGAFTGSQMRAIRLLSAAANSNGPELINRLLSPWLKFSLCVRIWIVIGATLLMSTQPGPAESLGIVVASFVFGCLSSLLKFGRKRAVAAVAANSSNLS